MENKIEKLRQQLLDAVVEELKQGRFDFVINDKGGAYDWLETTLKVGGCSFNIGVHKKDGLTAFHYGNLYNVVEEAMREFVAPAILEAYKNDERRRMEEEYERLKQILNK